MSCGDPMRCNLGKMIWINLSHDIKTGCLDMSGGYCKITTCYEVASARRWENGQVWQYQLPASCQSYVPKSTVIACILHKQTRNMCMLHDRLKVRLLIGIQSSQSLECHHSSLQYRSFLSTLNRNYNRKRRNGWILAQSWLQFEMHEDTPRE